MRVDIWFGEKIPSPLDGCVGRKFAGAPPAPQEIEHRSLGFGQTFPRVGPARVDDDFIPNQFALHAGSRCGGFATPSGLSGKAEQICGCRAGGKQRLAS
jgi:hypothetical protein